MEIRTTEFFKNLKSLPPEGSQEFKDLITWEEEKCKGGVKVNGVDFPGWLYFHLNHWWIRIDSRDKFGNITRIPSLPQLRDNEWIRSEAYEKCRTSPMPKGYMEVGLRQGGKSEFEASVTGYNALMFKDTQNVIVGGNDPDLALLKDKIDFGLKSMWKGLAIPRIDKDWRKPMVKLGYKTKDNEDDIWSYLVIRNASGGDNTEAPAGTTAKAFVMDEIGKYLFGQVFESAKPAFLSEFGWRTIPILVGTGGSFEKGEDAERFFYNPDANNFLAFEDPETGKKTCLFMSGIYRQDCKYETTLDRWLISEGKIPEGNYPDLAQIIIRVADKELATQKITEERAQKAKDPDQTEYLKAIMYHPLNPEECFLSTSANIFNITSAKKHQFNIREAGFFGEPVDLETDGTKIVHISSKKRPISSYPVKHNENKDAPPIIYEFPVEDPPFGLYVAGVDPYRQGKAEYSTSVGTVVVMKRMHDILSERFQNMIVATFAARPDEQDEWNETARNLIKFYNARTLCENDEMSFINYMIYKGDERYLEEQPGWLKTLVPTSSVDRRYGIHRSNDTIIDYLHSTLKNFLNEVLFREKDPETGSIIKELLGITRVPDIMILEEIIKFNPDGNFDRLIAFELAVALAKHLDPILGKAGQEDPRLKAYFDRARTKIQGPKLFRSKGGIFSRKVKLFK